FESRVVLAGDGGLTPAETPYVPSGRGGSIVLAGSDRDGSGALPDPLGISTGGNVRNEALPGGSADLFVAANRGINLNLRGSIGTYEGGRLAVEPVGGTRVAGAPPPGYRGRRGIVSLFRGPGFGGAPAETSGGGPIGIDVAGDFNIGGLALATLSGSDI